MNPLPPHVRAAAKRILDREAARLLAEQLGRDAAGTAARRDDDPGDGGADQVAAPGETEPVPVRRGRDGSDRGTGVT